MVIGVVYLWLKFINPNYKAIYSEIHAILKVQPHLYMVYQVLRGSSQDL